MFLKYTRKQLNFNFVARVGFNESQVIGSGQYPFTMLVLCRQTKLAENRDSTLEPNCFLTTSFKDYIKYTSLLPELNIDSNNEYIARWRFVGHELHINKISLRHN
jgi:hypothetical protein